MTCCVRENADQRLYGQASAMVSAPKPPSRPQGRCHRRLHRAARRREAFARTSPRRTSSSAPRRSRACPSFLPRLLPTTDRVVEVDTGEEGRGFSADLPSRRSQRLPRLGAHHDRAATTSARTASSRTSADARRAARIEAVVAEVRAARAPTACARSRSWGRTSTPMAATSTGSLASPSFFAPSGRPASSASASPRQTPRTSPSRPSAPWRRFLP